MILDTLRNDMLRCPVEYTGGINFPRQDFRFSADGLLLPGSDPCWTTKHLCHQLGHRMPINGPTAWFKIGSIFLSSARCSRYPDDCFRSAKESLSKPWDVWWSWNPASATNFCQPEHYQCRSALETSATLKLDQGAWPKGDHCSRISGLNRIPFCFKLAGSCFTGQKLKRIALEFLSNFLGCSFIFGFIQKPEITFSQDGWVDILSKNPRLDFRCR